MAELKCLQGVRDELQKTGLLLMQDAELPSLVSIVAGGRISGSWWSHAESHAMFDVLQVIADETLVTKLLGGKRTFVHPQLWPALCALGMNEAPWQTTKLRADASELLARVRDEGNLRSDQVDIRSSRKAGAIAEDLEKRLLITSSDEHTERGHHARVLESWAHWQERVKLAAPLPSPDRARATLEDAVRAYATGDAMRLLPWAQRSAKR